MTTKYTPIPPNGGDPQAYAFSELQDLSRALSEAQEFAFVQELHVAPERPRDGMVVLADGTDWNPGSGAGFYGYDGGWKPFSSGLAFPATQVSSSDVNTLDDYEEGTWTPTLTFGGGATGITYATQSGKYTKVGNLVYVTCRLELSNKGSSTGAALIGGLPFTVGDGWTENTTVDAPVGAAGFPAGNYVLGNSTSVYLFTNARTQLTDTAFTNTTDVRFGFCFRV